MSLKVQILRAAGAISVAALTLPASAAVIGWANLQWPPSITHVAGTPTVPIYGQVWIDGVTSVSGATPNLLAWVGFGTGQDPTLWTNWVAAAFNMDVGNNDEFAAALDPQYGGDYSYAYRYSYNGGPFVYADNNGPAQAPGLLPNPGRLTVRGPSAPPVVPVPVPATAPLVLLGLAALGLTRRRCA